MSILNAAAKRGISFSQEQGGAVTVDWIALTAALVFMGIAAAFYVTSSVPQVADGVVDYMENYEVGG